MITRYFTILSFAGGLLLFASACGNSNSKPGEHNAAIILGDTSTIVTERDSTNLKDFVTDLKPAVDTATVPVEQPKKDSGKVVVVTPAPPTATVEQTGTGLSVPFAEATVFVAGITTKPANKNQNPAKSNGVTYQLVSGNLNGAKIKITSGTVTKVSQRYQSIVKATDDGETLFLESLSNTTDWTALQGKSNTYTISGLAPGSLEADDITANSLRNAVSKAARQKRMSRSDEADWQKALKNARNGNKKPLATILRSVMWKVDGKDAKGKPFSKQIRVDVPLL